MKSIEVLINYIKLFSDRDTKELEDIFKNANEMYKKEIIEKYDQGSIETYNHLMNKLNPNRSKDKVWSSGSSDGYM